MVFLVCSCTCISSSYCAWAVNGSGDPFAASFDGANLKQPVNHFVDCLTFGHAGSQQERQVILAAFALPHRDDLESHPPLQGIVFALRYAFALEFDHHVKFAGHAHRAP